MRAVITKTTNTCSVCQKEFRQFSLAKACHALHLEEFKRLSPNYKIGSIVRTHKSSDLDYDLESTRIVRMKGKFLDLELLCENNNDERYWVPAVRYQTMDLRHNPADFDFVEMIGSC